MALGVGGWVYYNQLQWKKEQDALPPEERFKDTPKETEEELEKRLAANPKYYPLLSCISSNYTFYLNPVIYSCACAPYFNNIVHFRIQQFREQYKQYEEQRFKFDKEHEEKMKQLEEKVAKQKQQQQK